MKLLKLTLMVGFIWFGSASNDMAQVKKSTSAVNKATTSSSVEKDTSAPQYYELRCRGGVTYHSNNAYHLPVAQKLEFFITEGRLTEATQERMMDMSVTFAAGSKAVGGLGSNLEEGQCSWVDRAISPDEPFRINQEIIYFGQAKQSQHGTPVDHSATAAERHPDSMNIPEYLKDSNHYWSFFVRNTGQGYFEATSSRYWKPLKIDQQIRNGPRLTVPAEKKTRM